MFYYRHYNTHTHDSILAISILICFPFTLIYYTHFEWSLKLNFTPSTFWNRYQSIMGTRGILRSGLLTFYNQKWPRKSSQPRTRNLHQGWVSLRQVRKKKTRYPTCAICAFAWQLAIVLSWSLLFTAQEEETANFDRISEKIDLCIPWCRFRVLTQFPSASFHIFGEFSIHHKNDFEETSQPWTNPDVRVQDTTRHYAKPRRLLSNI